MLRREFALPSCDVEYLDSTHSNWEAIKIGSVNWLIISQFTVPGGYTIVATQVALRIEPVYPDTQIDMAYFYPALRREDGRAIPATESTETIDGKLFQRWSRHRTAENPWRPGVDDVSTHLAQVKNWLTREFQR